MRRWLPAMLVALALVPAPPAAAAGGDYVVVGGTPREQAQVAAALDASAFDWSLVPAEITIHIAPGIASDATPGHIWLDGDLLDAGVFSWGIVQHEYAHEVDYYLLDDAKRRFLLGVLGGRDWCYATPNLAHAAYGCERFASTLAWSYWLSPRNSLRPTTPGDEAAAMEPGAFRRLLSSLIGAPNVVPAHVTAYAPPKARKARGRK